MRFKTKDLMVSLSPKAIDAKLAAKLCLWRSRICIRPTLQPCAWWSRFCNQCSLMASCACTLHGTIGCQLGNSCGAGGSACDPTNIECFGSIDWIENPADLVTLREELTQVLGQLEELEAEGLPATLSNVSEVDAAEAALEEALAQVRRQKKQKG